MNDDPILRRVLFDRFATSIRLPRLFPFPINIIDYPAYAKGVEQITEGEQGAERNEFANLPQILLSLQSIFAHQTATAIALSREI